MGEFFDIYSYQTLFYAGMAAAYLFGLLSAIVLYLLWKAEPGWIGRWLKSFIARPHRSQRGSAFTILFGGVALLGTLGYGTAQYVRGPLATSITINRIASAETQMQMALRMSVVRAATEVGDCDEDGFVEPLAPRAAGGAPVPVNGGLLPNELGVPLSDPWGTQYAYCAWNQGPNWGGTASCPAGLLEGSTDETQAAGLPIIAIVSAGPSRQFTTTCANFNPGSPGDPLVVKAADSDDLVLAYTYTEALAFGGGLWRLKDSDTADIDKDVEIRASDDTVTASIQRETGFGMFNTVFTNEIERRDADQITVRDRTVFMGDRVGIGTETPSRPLDVRGEGVFRGRLSLTGYDSDPVAGSQTWHIDQNHQGRFRIFNQPDLFTPGTERMTILPNGNVGIGTDGPATTLHVNGGRIRQTESGGAGSVELWHGTSHGVVGTISNTQFSLRTNGIDRLNITPSGNVGVGTDNPQSRMHIVTGGAPNQHALTLSNSNNDGTNRGAVVLGARRSNANSPFVALGTWDNGSSRVVYYGGAGWAGTTNATEHRFHTAPSYADETMGDGTHVRMRVLPSGVDVTGNVTLSGAIISSVGVIRDANGGWIRTYGNSGWFSQTVSAHLAPCFAVR